MDIGAFTAELTQRLDNFSYSDRTVSYSDRTSVELSGFDVASHMLCTQ